MGFNTISFRSFSLPSQKRTSPKLPGKKDDDDDDGLILLIKKRLESPMKLENPKKTPVPMFWIGIEFRVVSLFSNPRLNATLSAKAALCLWHDAQETEL